MRRTKANLLALHHARLAIRKVGAWVDRGAAMVGQWRRWCRDFQLAGPYDARRTARKYSGKGDKAVRVLRTLMRGPSHAATPWSTRLASAKTGFSEFAVQRYFALQPHRTRTFWRLKVPDIVGPCLGLPD